MLIQQTIQNKITTAFKPAHLEVINESSQHSVPPGSETHFKIIVVSESFQGKTLVARHRLVNSLLAEELKNGVHALSLHILTPIEWEKKNQKTKPSPPCLGGS